MPTKGESLLQGLSEVGFPESLEIACYAGKSRQKRVLLRLGLRLRNVDQRQLYFPLGGSLIVADKMLRFSISLRCPYQKPGHPVQWCAPYLLDLVRGMGMVRLQTTSLVDKSVMVTG